MISAKYSLLGLFAIAAIIIVWIIFTRVYPQFNDEKTLELKEFELAQNELYRQVPRDNDELYTIPTYTPSQSQNNSRGKIEFKEGMDNDALYYTPVQIPEKASPPPVSPPAPVKQPVVEKREAYVAPAAPAQPAQPVQPAIQPVAPLRPQPRQPETPVYEPQYQQPQYEQEYQPQYQQPQPKAPSGEEEYPSYYYY